MSSQNAQLLLVMSCEQKYLQIYLPYWLSVADYLKPEGFCFHFVIIDDSDEAAALIDDAESLSQALARFRGNARASSGRNVSFSSIAKPSWCASVGSLAACARLLYARQISERTGMRVITLDIDFWMTDDPATWFAALPTENIALAPIRVKWSVDPWRRFGAGTYVLPHDELAFALSRRVEDYLLRGLGESNSWYLDQNALAYLYESVAKENGALEGSLVSLETLEPIKRPFEGFGIHALFEKRQGSITLNST